LLQVALLPRWLSGRESACQPGGLFLFTHHTFWEDPLEKGGAIDSGVLALEIPWTEEPGGLQSMGS